VLLELLERKVPKEYKALKEFRVSKGFKVL
jgi:hypothetical protein